MSRYALAAVVLLAGCGSATSLKNVWSAPDAQPIRFSKVLAVGIGGQETIRRTMEDEMVRVMSRVEAHQSYRVLSDAEFKSQEAAREKIRALGYDGVVIMRVVRQSTEQRYVPGSPMPTPYYSPWGYWGYSYSYAYSPGYVTSDEVVIVETNIYSVADEKLLWSAQSETMNPSNISSLVDGIAEATSNEMRRRGLLSN